MTKWEAYLRKSTILLNEAKKDLEIGCYNKAISASWFAIEAILRALLLFLRKPMMERPGALIGQIQRIFNHTYPDYKFLLPQIHSIYEKRKRADHRETLYGEKDAELVVRAAEEIISNISNKILNK